jgi:outer membrane receptor protein involved in Fe transport
MAVSYTRSLQRSTLSAALLSALILTANTAAAQENTDPTHTTEKTVDLDKVTVTGSRIKRAQIEGPSPITIISAQQISKEGFNTVHDALQTLSQNTGFGQNDFNANGGFTPNASVINLRGMGPGRTLLLINGRRANDYPFPYNGRSNFQNFNNIPAAAVERIEILAGGASAIYGSDAVAGVINVILKKNFEGNVVKVRGQTSTEGGRDIGDVQWVGGKAGENWSVTYAFESFNAEPLFSSQRDFMDSAQDNPAPPGVNGSAGVGGYQPPIGIQVRRQGGSTTNSYLQAAGRNCDQVADFRPWKYTSSVSGATLGPGCGYDGYPAQQTVANGNNDLSAYVYGTYNFDNGLEAWASVMGYHSRGRLAGGVEQWFGGPQPNGTFYDPQFGARILPIRALTPSSYGGHDGMFQKFEEDSLDVAFGLHGTVFDRFDWDWTIGGAKYHAVRDRPRMTVSGATNYFMGPRLGTTTSTTAPGVPAGVPIYRLNLDHFYGPISPEDYASMSTMVHYDGKSDNASTSFVFTGDLFNLPAGPVGFASVLEASRQSYDLKSDPRIFPAVREIYNLTGTGGGGERSRYAAGAELSIPMLSSLTLDLSGRYDKYDDVTDVNDARTWGAGLEWRPFGNLLIRGSYATSFKAPDLHYVFAEASGSFGTVTDYTRCVNEGIAAAVCSGAGARYNYAAFTTSQGQRTLKEETGESWTAGFVWDVTENLSLSADYYRIDLEDVVSVQSGTAILEGELGCATGFYPNGNTYPFADGSSFCNAIHDRITRDPDTGALTEIRSGPINLAFQGTTGIDGTVRYRWNMERFGDFNASLNWSHVLEQTSRATPDAALLQYRDDNSNSDFRSRIRMTLGWTKDEWDATVFMNRLGSFPIWQPAAADPTSPRYLGVDTRIAPFTTWNFSVGKQITDKLGVRFIMTNVFDNHHPRDVTMNSYPYFFQSYDFIGRQVGLEGTFKFN